MPWARAVASSVRLNQPNQFASSSSPRTRTSSKPAPRGVALEVGRHERVDVDHPLERVVVARRRPPFAGGRGHAASAAARAARAASAARLGIGRDPVAVARRLAGEEQRPAGREHAQELGERAVEVGQVVQHRVAEHEVEALVVERQRGRVARRGLDLQAELARRWRSSVSSIPGEMSVQVAAGSRRPASG